MKVEKIELTCQRRSDGIRIVCPFVFIRAGERIVPVWMKTFDHTPDVSVQLTDIIAQICGDKPKEYQTLEEWHNLPLQQLADGVWTRQVNLVGLRHQIGQYALPGSDDNGEVTIFHADAYGLNWYGVHVPSIGAGERFLKEVQTTVSRVFGTAAPSL